MRVVWSVVRRARRSGLESEERRDFMLVSERIVKGILGVVDWTLFEECCCALDDGLMLFLVCC